MEKIGKIVVVGIMVVLIGIVSGYLYYHPTTGIIETHETIQPIDYMQNIPPKPEDYEMIMRELGSGYINIMGLNSSYWLQPDFYPSWRHAEKFYSQHDYSRWGVGGYGAYPGNPEIIFNKKTVGTWIEDCTLFKTGYGIETWQGVKLAPENNEYFDVTLEPNELLLEPTFPVFSDNWVRIVKYRVSIIKEPPIGEYTIKVYQTKPSKEQSEIWFWEVLRKASNPEEQEMITRAKLQAHAKGKTSDQFENWIKVGRKNRYIDGSTFQTTPIPFKVVIV